MYIVSFRKPGNVYTEGPGSSLSMVIGKCNDTTLTYFNTAFPDGSLSLHDTITFSQFRS